MEAWFIKNGDTYDKIVKMGGMTLETETVTTSDVESEVLTIGFFTAYHNDTDVMNKVGTETIAGRSCDKFSDSAAAIGVAVNWTYFIDRETGVCLKYQVDQSAGNISMTFECTEFKTSGVSLPAYR